MSDYPSSGNPSEVGQWAYRRGLRHGFRQGLVQGMLLAYVVSTFLFALYWEVWR